LIATDAQKPAARDARPRLSVNGAQSLLVGCGADTFISSTNCITGRFCATWTDTDDVFSSFFLINTSFIYQRPKLPRIMARSAPSINVRSEEGDAVHVVVQVRN
jgi:hypothetical protein